MIKKNALNLGITANANHPLIKPPLIRDELSLHFDYYTFIHHDF